jgi:hypothetical protein
MRMQQSSTYRKPIATSQIRRRMNSESAMQRKEFLANCDARERPAATIAIDKLIEFSTAKDEIQRKDIPDDHNTSLCYVVKARGCVLWKAYAEQQKVEFLVRWPDTLTAAEGVQFRSFWKRIRGVELQPRGKGSVAALPFTAFENNRVWSEVVALLEWGCQLETRQEG